MWTVRVQSRFWITEGPLWHMMYEVGLWNGWISGYENFAQMPSCRVRLSQLCVAQCSALCHSAPSAPMCLSVCPSVRTPPTAPPPQLPESLCASSPAIASPCDYQSPFDSSHLLPLPKSAPRRCSVGVRPLPAQPVPERTRGVALGWGPGIEVPPLQEQCQTATSGLSSKLQAFSLLLMLHSYE